MCYDLIDDISTITTVPKCELIWLNNKATELIGSYSLEISNGDCKSDIDVGIGKITVSCVGTEVFYAFTPSAKLEKTIAGAIKSGKDPLVKDIEKCVTKRMLKAYKDLL